jgi:hypothetical protein
MGWKGAITRKRLEKEATGEKLLDDFFARAREVAVSKKRTKK